MAQTDKLIKSAERYEHKAKRYENKTEHFEAKLSKAQLKADGKPKTTHTLVTYAERNEITGKKELHFRIDKETKTNHTKPRGLVHKLDAHFKTENILSPTAKRIASFAGVKANALVVENWALKGIDTAKNTVRPLSSVAKVQAMNAVYSAGMQNTGFSAVTKTASATKAVLNSVHKWRVERKSFNTQNKGQKLEYKREKFQAKVDKFDLKAATTKEKVVFNSNRTAFGLSPKISREEKKKSWKKVFDGNNKSSYLQKPTGSEKIDKLERKQYNAAKKVYQTRTVKEAYVNTATGKVQTRKKKVVDTSAKKVSKLKKPNSLAFNLVSATGASIRSVGLSKMSQADEASVQAAGKALQFGVSELPKMRAATQKKSKLKMDSHAAKANAKLEKATSKLQVEKSKPTSSMDKSKMKKSQQKKRSAKSFKEKSAKALKKMKTQVVDGVKKFIVKKAKYAALAIGGLIVLLTLPLSLLGMVGGGGGGVMGGAVGVTVYPTQDDVLTATGNAFNKKLWNVYDAYKIMLNSHKGESGVLAIVNRGIPSFQYDMNKLAAFLSAYHRNDWTNVNSMLDTIVSEMYEPRFIEAQEVHITMADDKGKPIEVTKYVLHYQLVQKKSLDELIYAYLQQQDEGTGATDHQDHYAGLMRSEGGHQIFGTLLANNSPWHDRAYVYGSVPGELSTAVDRLKIHCDANQVVIASASGRVISKSNNSMAIKYDNGYVVTYYGEVSNSTLTTGSVVQEKTPLFTTAPAEYGKSNLDISVYSSELAMNLNPYYLFESYDGQIEDNQKDSQDQAEEAMQPTAN